MEMEYTNGVHMIMRSLSDCGSSATNGTSDEDVATRKGPWAEEEDSALVNYVTIHGEGHWNSVARSAGLRRTGKSCRLRWLNYLRPNVRRGNITLQEQLLILDLHSRWGNRWSKIAEHLPGRTDNEIKNYWRTRVVKQAKQLKCDVNSKRFRDALRYVWMPRLMEQIQASNSQQLGQSAQAQSHGAANDRGVLSSSSGVVAAARAASSSLSDSCASYGNVMGDGADKGATSTPLLQQTEDYYYADAIAFETEVAGFGGADMWTDENVWFLQQQLADELL